MNNPSIALAFALCVINSPALSRSPQQSGTATCEGRIEVAGQSTPGWYTLNDCFFDANTSAGKAILDACGVNNPCRIKAFGKWAPDFHVERIISAQRIDKMALNEMPEEFRGTWNLYLESGEPGTANGSGENQMPVGTTGIGWLKGVCLVTAVESNGTSTTTVKQTCVERGKITELWTLRKLNGMEMLIVATTGASSPAFTPHISIYVKSNHK